jgi:hypothetical protein
VLTEALLSLNFWKSGCDDPVPAGILGLVKALVGKLDEGLDGIGRAESAAATDSYADFPALGCHWPHCGRRANPFGDLYGATKIGPRKYDQEFLATPPAGDVAGPQAVPDAIRERPQDQVASRMTVGVVDVFEVVKVE